MSERRGGEGVTVATEARRRGWFFFPLRARAGFSRGFFGDGEDAVPTEVRSRRAARARARARRRLDDRVAGTTSARGDRRVGSRVGWSATRRGASPGARDGARKRRFANAAAVQSARRGGDARARAPCFERRGTPPLRGGGRSRGASAAIPSSPWASSAGIAAGCWTIASERGVSVSEREGEPGGGVIREISRKTNAGREEAARRWRKVCVRVDEGVRRGGRTCAESGSCGSGCRCRTARSSSAYRRPRCRPSCPPLGARRSRFPASPRAFLQAGCTARLVKRGNLKPLIASVRRARAPRKAPLFAERCARRDPECVSRLALAGAGAFCRRARARAGAGEASIVLAANASAARVSVR